jgi:hypothetical protein
MKNFKFPLGCGVEVLLKSRCKSTVLAKFYEDHPKAVDSFSTLQSAAGSVTLDKSAAEMFLRGLSVEDTEAVISFLVDRIDGFEVPEGVGEEWEELDWKGLATAEREEEIDYLLSTLDLISLFIATWAQYQVGSRARREKTEEHEPAAEPEKKRKRVSKAKGRKLPL